MSDSVYNGSITWNMWVNLDSPEAILNQVENNGHVLQYISKFSCFNDIDELTDFCKKNNLLIREQCQQSFYLKCSGCGEEFVNKHRDTTFRGSDIDCYDNHHRSTKAWPDQSILDTGRYTHKCGDDDTGDWGGCVKQYISNSAFRRTGVVLICRNGFKYKNDHPHISFIKHKKKS